ncbi:MAG: DNA primase [Bacteroidales bacterium]
MIKPDTVEAIIETARIEEVVSDFVSLKRRGSGLIGLCPFHNERTPSFNVSPARGIFKCFGCGKGGNAVNFVMEHEHYTYPEALRYLAKKYNIAIEEEEQTPEQAAVGSERESLYNVSAYAQKFFTEQLFGQEQGKAIGLSYFHERGFTDETIHKFQLGYCTDKWDELTLAAVRDGYSHDMLEKSGLSISKDERHYDRFRDRVMFPIHNLSGRVIGFGGRILSSDKTKPKYVNSPESEIYNKSKVLYGIYFARTAIAAADNCFLVEGYTDVISLHQAGINNVVSSSGTSLTNEQVKQIRRFTPNITILYDGDPAGIKASFRGIDMILEQGMNVKIVLFPDGEDPDSFARKHRTADVQEFITKSASDFIRFKIDLLLDETGNDPLKRVAVLKEFITSISLIPDQLTRLAYVKESCEKLGLSEQAILNELNKTLRNKHVQKAGLTKDEAGLIMEDAASAPQQGIELDAPVRLHPEREIIRILMLYGNHTFPIIQPPEGKKEVETLIYKVADYIVHDLRNDDITFEDKVYQAIFNEFSVAVDKGDPIDHSNFLHHPDAEVARVANDLVSTPYELSNNWEKKKIAVPLEQEDMQRAVISSILAFKSGRVEQLMADIQKKMKALTPEDDALILLVRQKELKKLSMAINKQLGRVVVR